MMKFLSPYCMTIHIKSDYIKYLSLEARKYSAFICIVILGMESQLFNW